MNAKNTNPETSG